MPAPSTALAALGRNVRALREKKKLTQEALGERAELHTTYISDIERSLPARLALLQEHSPVFSKELQVWQCSIIGEPKRLADINAKCFGYDVL